MKRWLLAICSLVLFSAGSIAQTVYLQEDFEGGALPADWQIKTNATDGGWLFGTAGQLGSSYWPFQDNGSLVAATNDDGCNCDKSVDYLITPEMDLTDAVAPVLTFDLVFGGLAYQGVVEVAHVEASTDGGVTWEVVEVLSGSGGVNWGNASIALGAYTGNSSVHLAFRYNDGGSWLYGFAIDNVKVFDLPGKDVNLKSLNITQFNETGSNVVIAGTVVNNGGETLNSFDLTWSEGGNDYSETVSGISVPTFGSYNFTHSTAFVPADPVSYNINVTVANPNGGVDNNTDDNELGAVVSGVSYIPTKRAFAEEATGTWCPWCTRGTLFMDSMANQYQDLFVGIAVHNSDPMEVTAYDDGLTSFPGFTGFPSVLMDRSSIVDPSQLVSAVPNSLTRIAPVDVSIDGQFETATNTITYTVSAEFVTQLEGIDYRINGVIVEDGVTGTGSGYNQANAYAGGGFGAMGGFELLPNPIPAADMVYDHVGRALMAGWDGQDGSVPASVSAGNMASYTFTYTIPASSNPENMHVVGMVINNATGEVLNSISTDVSELTVVSNKEIEEAFSTFSVMPTITNSTSNVEVAFENAQDVTIFVFDANGRLISNEKVENVLTHRFEVNLTNQAAGTYFVNVSVNGQSRVATIVKQ